MHRSIGLRNGRYTNIRHAIMASGCDIAAISDELFISKSAVRAHASRIYAKFAVHNRQEFNEVLDAYLPPLPEEESSGS